MKKLFGWAVALALLVFFAVVTLKARDLNDFANLLREWLT
jgi:hypothetical protein